MSDFRKYGMIVVGGGITGLSSGRTWAMYHDVKEEPVLIIEKEPKTGKVKTIDLPSGVEELRIKESF